MKKVINALIVLLFCSINMSAQTYYDRMTLENILSNQYYLYADNKINGSDNQNNLLITGKTVVYLTNEGRYGKFEVQQYAYNLTIRWTTYNNNGTVYSSGSNLTISGTFSCDLDLGKQSQTSADFWWEQKTSIERYLMPLNKAAFYPISESTQSSTNSGSSNAQNQQVGKTKEQRDAETVETGVKVIDGILDIFEKRKEKRAKKQAESAVNEPETKIEQPISKGKKESIISSPTTNEQTISRNDDAVSAAVVWLQPLSNHTNTPTLALKACVETAETIKEYILVQNGQRSYTTRGLIVKQTNDCTNAFNKTVTLKTGENQFQLIAIGNNGEFKSEIFSISYDPDVNAVSSKTKPQQNSIPPILVICPSPDDNAASTKTQPQQRLALVIGNAGYPSPSNLNNPANDATDMAAALTALGFDVISAINVDKRKMSSVIEDFGKRLKNYALGFFFYAGHGLQIKGENYLVPIDAKIKSQGDVEYECYPIGRVLSKMDEANNQSNIIVLDACRNNPLARSWSRSTGSNGLANINAPQGTFIGFATSPGSTADDGSGRNGIYTGALLQHIRKPNLTVDQLFNAVNGTVKKLTNNQQVPWKASSMSEDLYLTK